MEIHQDSEIFTKLLRKFYALLQFQYGINRGKLDLLDESQLIFILSKNTDRLRFIEYKNELMATYRTNDGNLVFTEFGANIIKNLLPIPNMRVVIPAEITSYIAKGRNLFAKHILSYDPKIRPESEVFIVDPEDNLIAVGKIIMNKDDIDSFKSGLAVKVR